MFLEKLSCETQVQQIGTQLKFHKLDSIPTSENSSSRERISRIELGIKKLH